MSTNTVNMGMGKAVDGDNAKTYLETTLGAALDLQDAHDHSGGTHGLATLNSTTLASPTLTGTTTGAILTLSGLLTCSLGATITTSPLTVQAGLNTNTITVSSTTTLQANLVHTGTNIGFFSAGVVSKQTVTGSRGANAALASVLTALANYGLITDSSS